MSLRHSLGRSLITLGRYVYGSLEAKPQESFPDMQLPMVKGGTVVEETEEQVTWSPEQHGNVVIAEPELMTQFRRENP